MSGLQFEKRQIDSFKEIVLSHLGKFESGQYESYRIASCHKNKWLHDFEESLIDFEPAVLVEKATAVFNLGFDDVKKLGAYEEVSSVCDHPLLFSKRSGMYFYALSHRQSIQCWLTWPAYPPGW